LFDFFFGVLFLWLAIAVLGVRIAIGVFVFLGWLEVDALAFLFLSLLHPVDYLLHSLHSLALVLVNVELILILTGAELSPNDLANFLTIFYADVL
jgi:hypothetical protein